MKTTAEIAHRLVELCRVQDYATAYQELYSTDIVSTEAESSPEPRVARGMDAVMVKMQMFADTYTVHSGTVSDPILAGNFFSCAFTLDVTAKAHGARFTMAEIAVYEVKDGKIIKDQFFYTGAE